MCGSLPPRIETWMRWICETIRSISESVMCTIQIRHKCLLTCTAMTFSEEKSLNSPTAGSKRMHSSQSRWKGFGRR